MSYTCFPRLELWVVAHPHMCSKLELPTIEAHELSGVWTIHKRHSEKNCRNDHTTLFFQVELVLGKERGRERETRPAVVDTTETILQTKEEHTAGSAEYLAGNNHISLSIMRLKHAFNRREYQRVFS